MSIILIIIGVVGLIFAFNARSKIDQEEKSSNSFSSANNSFDVPQEMKDLYSGMTMKQKAAAMNIMTILGGSCPGTPSNISKINQIMTIAGRSMQITGNQYKSYTDSFGGIKGMINELKNVNDRAIMDSLFLSFFSIVSIGKSEQAMTVLLGIYSEFGYSEDDCLEILQKTQALSNTFG